jgi:hypothetical protein
VKRGEEDPRLPRDAPEWKWATARLSPELIKSIDTHATVVHDNLGRLFYASPRFERLVGWDCGRQLGKEPPHPWWPPEERGREQKALEFWGSGEALRRGLTGARIRLIGSDGEAIPIDAEYRSLVGLPWMPMLHVIVMKPVRPSDQARIAEPDPVEPQPLDQASNAKALCWLTPPLRTPPFSPGGRRIAGYLLRKLQRGARLWRPEMGPAAPLGKGCRELRFRDPEANTTWRIVCRVERREVIVLAYYDRKTMPAEVADACKRRLREYVGSRRGRE